MRSAKLFALVSATAAAVAATAAPSASSILPEGATTAIGFSTAQDNSMETGSASPSTRTASVPAVSASTTPSLTWTNLEPSTRSHIATSNSSGDPYSEPGAETTAVGVTRSVGFPNATTTLASSLVPTQVRNATTTQISQVTGGAIPQQMQSSMAALLGFCIMGLVML